MKKIIFSSAMIIAVAAIVVTATSSYFSDTETSTGNTFTAGAIDLTVDSQCTYNGLTSDQCGTWNLKDLVDDSEDPLVVGDRFFNFSDLKPGDWGENTISLHVDNNPAWACAQITVTSDEDVTCTEPEIGDDDTCVEETTNAFNGEIAKKLSLAWWADDGDNVLEDDEHVFFMNGATLSELLAAGGDPTNKVLNLTLADINTNFFLGINNAVNTTPLDGSQDYHIGMQWCFGDMDINGTTITCDGGPVNNEAQTDSLTADISFSVEQFRNNDAFECPDSFRIQ